MVRCSLDEFDIVDKAVISVNTGAVSGMAANAARETARIPEGSGLKAERKLKKGKKSKVEYENNPVNVSSEELKKFTEIEKSPNTRDKSKHHKKHDKNHNVDEEQIAETSKKNKKKRKVDEPQAESVESKKHKKTKGNDDCLPSLEERHEGDVDHTSAAATAKIEEFSSNVKHTDDAHNLLERMSMVLKTGNDDVEDYRTTLKNFDWEKVNFDGYSAEDCKRFCLTIIKPLRKYRTLSDLVDEAKSVKKIQTRFHKTPDPDMPKRPTTPLFLFFKKKRKSFQRKYPDLSVIPLTSLMAKKFAKMSASKKQKYIDAYEKEKMIYVQQMNEYREIHRKAPTVRKQISAAEYYVRKKSAKKLQHNEGGSKKKILRKYQLKWKSLTDADKVAFIRKALDAEKKRVDATDEEAASALTPQIVLSKVEQKLINKADGVSFQKKSPAYALFVEKFLSRNKAEHGESPRNLFVEAAAAWQDLSPKKRMHYRSKVSKRKHKLERSRKGDNKEAQETENADNDKLRRALKNKPKKPGNAYNMFVCETFKTLSNLLTPHERMQKCSQLWSSLSAGDKENWKSKSMAALKDYQEKFKSIKESLSNEQFSLYEQSLKKKKKKTPKSKIPEDEQVKSSPLKLTKDEKKVKKT